MPGRSGPRRSFRCRRRPATKSGIYRGAVTEAAVAGVLAALARYERGDFEPEALDYCRPDVRGTLRPVMKQADRAIDWSSDPTARIVAEDPRRRQQSRRARCDADRRGRSSCTGAHEEDRLRGAPGQFLAQREGAVCIGTVNGALWVSHLKAKSVGPYAGIKLPAAQVLGPRLEGVPERPIAPTDANDHRTFRDIVYSERRRRRLSRLRLLQRCDEHPAVPPAARCLSTRTCRGHEGHRAARGPSLLLERHSSQHDRGGPGPGRRVVGEHQRDRRSGARHPRDARRTWSCRRSAATPARAAP